MSALNAFRLKKKGGKRSSEQPQDLMMFGDEFNSYRIQSLSLTGANTAEFEPVQVLYPVLPGTMAPPVTNGQTPNTTPTPRPRKTAVVGNKSGLGSHSAKTLVKKAAAGIHDGSSSYSKAIYQDKYMMEIFDKYILTKSEGADTWWQYMKDEDNSAIKCLYENICELDKIWVRQQQKYRVELPEQRNLFKQLMKGEQEIHKLQKQAISAAAKTTKTGKNLDEALSKGKINKGLDLRKLEILQNELAKAVDDNEKAQARYVQGIENYKKFKHNQVRKMLTCLAEAESQLHQDLWNISEAKLQLCKIFMEHPYSKSSQSNIHRASSRSQEIMNVVYRGLGMAQPAQSDLARPVQPATVTSNRIPPPATQNHQRIIPSAPASDNVSVVSGGSSMSNGSSGMDLADSDACYNPIGELSDEDDDTSPNYIYEFEDNEFDDDVEGEVYENVETPDQGPSYLDLLDGDTPKPVMRNGPPLPPRLPSRPTIDDSDVYEESDIDYPLRPLVIRQKPSNKSDDIFGEIGNYRRPVSPEGEYADPNDLDEEGGTYGHIWEAQSGANVVPTPARITNNHHQARSSNRDSTMSLETVEETRYTMYPGASGETPARPPQSTMESQLRNSLAAFERTKDTPPPLPPARR